MNFKIKGWGGVILLSAVMLGGAAWYMRSFAPPATPAVVSPVAPAIFEIPASATLLAVEQRLVQNLPRLRHAQSGQYRAHQVACCWRNHRIKASRR
jgi:hypothetical protein